MAMSQTMGQHEITLRICIRFLHFFTKIKKLHVCKEYYQIGTHHACSIYLYIEAFVAKIMELKARAGTIFRNCEKSNDGNPRKR